jgi:chemotaxis protein methyltransferase CheR
MVAAAAAPTLGGVPVEILATDFSERALARAREGLYSEFEVRRGLAPQHLARWFVREPGGLRVAAPLRCAVRFQRQNLLESFAGLGTFDIVLCRNVLLYFDAPTRARVLDAIADVMRPGALLLLGGTESTLGTSARFRRAEHAASIAFERVDG